MSMYKNLTMSSLVALNILCVASPSFSKCEFEEREEINRPSTQTRTLDKNENFFSSGKTFLSQNAKALKDKIFSSPEEYDLPESYSVVGVALFSGKDPISEAIKKVTHSKTSHVGLILADADADPKDKRSWFCFESTGAIGEILRYKPSKKFPHVRTTPWNEVVKNYRGGVSYRKFKFSSKKRIDSDIVTDFVNKYNGKLFLKNPIRGVKALLGKNKASKSDDTKTVFCSELDALALMHFGILKRGISGNYLPKHFTEEYILPLCKGVTLKRTISAKKAR